MKKLLPLMLAAILLAGCTDAEWSKSTRFNAKYRVTVWSGGKSVATYVSTGAVESEEHTDGWFFRDSASQLLVRVSGTVTIEELK